jgi:hypothetical protein
MKYILTVQFSPFLYYAVFLSCKRYRLHFVSTHIQSRVQAETFAPV